MENNQIYQIIIIFKLDLIHLDLILIDNEIFNFYHFLIIFIKIIKNLNIIINSHLYHIKRDNLIITINLY